MLTPILKILFMVMVVLAAYNLLWWVLGWGGTLNLSAGALCAISSWAWWELDLIKVRS